jgi:hypothetical protein
VFGVSRVPLNAVGGGNPDGTPPELSARDAVLLESFAVRNGVPEAADSFATRTRAALEGRARFGTRVFAVATAGELSDDRSLAEFGWWTASAFGVDAYGWGAPHYSASTSRLPTAPRPNAEGALAGAAYASEVTFQHGRWQRSTTIGTIVVDTSSRTGTLENH